MLDAGRHTGQSIFKAALPLRLLAYMICRPIACPETNEGQPKLLGIEQRRDLQVCVLRHNRNVDIAKSAQQWKVAHEIKRRLPHCFQVDQA